MHNHDHSHAPAIKGNPSLAFYVAILLNITFVVVELAAGFIFRSTVLQSDAWHNLGDVSGLVLGLLAVRLAMVRPGKVLTYGWKKASIAAPFLNALILMLGTGMIAREGIERIFDPEPVNGAMVMAFSAVGIVINAGSALLFRSSSEDLNMKAAYLHLMADALVSLTAVGAGLVIHFTGWMIIDGITTVGISVFILFSTYQLLKESTISLLDGVPAGIDAEKVLQSLRDIEGVTDVHHLHIWSISTDETALSCHLKIEEIHRLEDIKHSARHILEHADIRHSTLEFELPDEPCEADGCFVSPTKS